MDIDLRITSDLFKKLCGGGEKAKENWGVLQDLYFYLLRQMSNILEVSYYVLIPLNIISF